MTIDDGILVGFGALLGMAFVGALMIAREALSPTRPLHIEDHRDQTKCGLPIGPNLALPAGSVAVAARCGTVVCEDCQRADVLAG